jgi:hypothetical protein
METTAMRIQAPACLQLRVALSWAFWSMRRRPTSPVMGEHLEVLNATSGITISTTRPRTAASHALGKRRKTSKTFLSFCTFVSHLHLCASSGTLTHIRAPIDPREKMAVGLTVFAAGVEMASYGDEAEARQRRNQSRNQRKGAKAQRRKGGRRWGCESRWGSPLGRAQAKPSARPSPPNRELRERRGRCSLLRGDWPA